MLVPKEVAQSLSGASQKPRSVLSNVERRLSLASKLGEDDQGDK